MRPTDALLMKRVLLKDMGRLLAASEAAGQGIPLNSPADAARELMEIVPDAPTYFVSDEMTAIARSAGKTLPAEDLTLDMLPSRSGFMVFGAPAGEARFTDERIPVRGFAWTACLVTSAESDDQADAQDAAGYEPAHEEIQLWPLIWVQGHLIPTAHQSHTLCPRGYEYAGFAEPYDGIPVEDLATLPAAWLLMQGSMSTTSKAHAPRRDRNLLRRSGLGSEVVVVRLRRLSGEPAGDGDTGSSSGVAWDHRWLVSGHWRNQHYPSEGVNRQRWIHPYIKGPADRPLIVKERVTAWVR